MKTELQDTKLYKDFIKVLNIQDMVADDNSFVVACCKVAEEYASQSNAPAGGEISNELMEQAISEIVGDKLSKKDRVIPVHYVLATLEWMQSKLTHPVVTEDDIDAVIEKIEDMHPYKQAGNRDSYSEYNEGWSDACDILGQAFKELLNQKR